MAVSIALVIIMGYMVNKFLMHFKIPGLLGMIILGMIVGPYGLNLLNEELMIISPDLRKIALIIILLRAGLGIKKEEISQVGVVALKMSLLPCIVEGMTIAVASMVFLKLSFVEGGILGFIIAAVSPAVVVPGMLDLMEKGKGMVKKIPTIILSAASIDDVFAITLFSTFLSFYLGEKSNIGLKLLGIPVSILLGIVFGGIIGYILVKLFKKLHIRDTEKVIIILVIGIFFTAIEDGIKDKLPIASLLGIMVIGYTLLDKYPQLSKRLSLKFNKLWIVAEIILFVLVGAEVNVKVILNTGMVGLLVLVIGLVGRSVGVYIALLGSKLNLKEKLFCIVSFVPKATVQAAMGAVPLASGVLCGDLILGMAVLAILVTAPIGAFGIKYLGDKWL